MGWKLKKESLKISGHRWENIKYIKCFQNESIGWERKNFEEMLAKISLEWIENTTLRFSESRDLPAREIKRKSTSIENVLKQKNVQNIENIPN